MNTFIDHLEANVITLAVFAVGAIAMVTVGVNAIKNIKRQQQQREGEKDAK